jgi:hypothetical protein
MKNLVIITFLLVQFSLCLKSQTWGGVSSANAFTTNANDAFRSGNVGIGFTATGIAYPLQVFNPNTGQGTKVLFGTSGTLLGPAYATSASVLQIQALGASSNGYLSIHGAATGTGSFECALTSSSTGANLSYGRLGTQAQMPFTITESGVGTERMRIRTDAGTKVTFGNYANTNTLVGPAPATNDAVVQVISPAGTSTLMLASNVNATATSYTAMNLSASSTVARIGVGTATFSAIPLLFSVGSEAMRIWPSGQIGVGTTTTALNTTKFAVEGLISCRELKVVGLAAPWPDYVLDANYQKRSFADMHTYITTNHHLPYLPSAATIEADNNSINVGETQVGMVRSLEELYLYMFDLKKENEELRKEIEALKAQH